MNRISDIDWLDLAKAKSKIVANFYYGEHPREAMMPEVICLYGRHMMKRAGRA